MVGHKKGYAGTCPKHGKWLWTSRKVARRSAHIHLPGEKMEAYRCDAVVGMWHLGHMSESVVAGILDRAQLREVKEKHRRGDDREVSG